MRTLAVTRYAPLLLFRRRGHLHRAPPPEHAAVGRERRDAVARLLQELPLEQRQVLVLREMEGLSYSELADVLGVPVGTVTSRLIRGRERLRALAKEKSRSSRPGQWI